MIDTGLEYVPGDPVSVHVVSRERRLSVSDGGGAVARTGRPRGWHDARHAVARSSDVNISRDGVVSLPVVSAGPGQDAIVRRIGEASLDLYLELLELQP